MSYMFYAADAFNQNLSGWCVSLITSTPTDFDTSATSWVLAFGEDAGTSLTNAMDIARGGRFQSVPSPYPGGAWYTYDDQTCDYGCMATEYIYWAMTSVLGAQENRAGEIQQEWKLNTKAKVQQMDTAIYQLLTDPQYVFPIVLPDGTYRR